MTPDPPSVKILRASVFIVFCAVVVAPLAGLVVGLFGSDVVSPVTTEYGGIYVGWARQALLFRNSFFIATGTALSATLLGAAAGAAIEYVRVPASGSISLRGEIVGSPGRIIVSPDRRDVGMVFQDFALWPHMTAGRHIDFVLKARGWKSGDRKRRVVEMLSLVGLAEKTHVRPGKLSGGEKQRLGIARALALRPSILLLDEPFSNLDEANRDKITAAIRQLKETGRVTLLMAAHDKVQADGLADDVFLMRPIKGS